MNYVEMAMQPTYDAGKQIKAAHYVTGQGKRKKVKKGKGAHKERVEAVRRKLVGTGSAPAAFESDTENAFEEKKLGEAEAQPSVFQSVFDQTKEAFTKKLNGFAIETTAKLKATSDDIIKDFNRRYSVEEEDTTNDPQAKQKLLNAAHEALAVLEGVIKQQLDECKRWEKEGDDIMTS